MDARVPWGSEGDLDVDLPDARQRYHFIFNGRLELRSDGTRRGREGHDDLDVLVVLAAHLDAVDEPEIDHTHHQLGILHFSKGLADFVLSGHGSYNLRGRTRDTHHFVPTDAILARKPERSVHRGVREVVLGYHRGSPSEEDFKSRQRRDGRQLYGRRALEPGRLVDLPV